MWYELCAIGSSKSPIKYAASGRIHLNSQSLNGIENNKYLVRAQ